MAVLSLIDWVNSKKKKKNSRNAGSVFHLQLPSSVRETHCVVHKALLSTAHLAI